MTSSLKRWRCSACGSTIEAIGNAVWCKCGRRMRVDRYAPLQHTSDDRREADSESAEKSEHGRGPIAAMPGHGRGRLCVQVGLPASEVVKRLGMPAADDGAGGYGAALPGGGISVRDVGRCGEGMCHINLSYDAAGDDEAMEDAIRRVLPAVAAEGLIQLAGWV
jgi:hypothetical protein